MGSKASDLLPREIPQLGKAKPIPVLRKRASPPRFSADLALLRSMTKRAMQPRKQSSPERKNVAEKPAKLAIAAPAAPVAAVPSPVDVE